MQSLKEYVKDSNKANLLKEFNLAKSNTVFSTLVDTLPLEDDILCKYTSLLNDAAIECDNCCHCKSLDHCKNSLKGYRYVPLKNDNSLSFGYEPCKFMKDVLDDSDYQKNVKLFHLSRGLKNARMKDIYTDDKSRVEIIKLLVNYCNDYLNDKKNKGIYLYGNFGCGKTYLIAALFNELAKNGVSCAMIHFPEFLRVLKSSFSNPESDYETNFSYVKGVSLLLIDDIGAENLTSWGRDEVLGTILQYRMENNLATFFTSNMSLEELENHLSDTGNKIDKLKARRLIERIKYLTDEKKLVGVSRRN